MDRMYIRLIDFVSLIPSDIETGIIKRKNGSKITFRNISELMPQYQLDYIEAFDIRPNTSGERVLCVSLLHN